MGIVIDYTGGFFEPSPAGESVGTVTLTVMGVNEVDLSTGNVFFTDQIFSASNGGTFSFLNPPASGTAYGFTLRIQPQGTTPISWPASVDWAGGTAPTAPASGETDVYAFYTQDGGTTYYGFQAGDAMA